MTEHDYLPGRIVGHEPGAFYNRLAKALGGYVHEVLAELARLRGGRLREWNAENAASSLTSERLQAAYRRFLGRSAPGR